MRRRDLLIAVLMPFVWSGHCPAQSQPDVRRIGLLSTLEPGDPQGRVLIEAFKEGLRERGWIIGRNLIIEERYTGARTQLLGQYASELVQSKVELIVTHGTPPVEAARKVAPSLPIVFATIGDPVGAGLVASLSRPGGNITGLSLLASDLSTKRLELMKETIPSLDRVAMLWNPANASLALQLRETEVAARSMGIGLISLPVQAAADLDPAIKDAYEQRAGAIITTSDNMQVSRRMQIVESAMQYKLPVIAEYREIAEAGALLSYGPSRKDSWRRSAAYVDRILRGSAPADLPVEQPARFELVLNRKSAKRLSIEPPRTILVRADEVIE